MENLPAFAPQDTSTAALVLDEKALDSMLSVARIMSTAVATVPRHLQKNEGDCLAVVMQSMQWGMNPFAVAQKTHLINGTLGYEAQLVTSVINTRAPIKERLNYEWFGPWEKVIGKFEIKRGEKGEYRVPGWKMADEEGCGVRVWTTMRGESEPRVLELLLAQARTRNSTLWADDPKQQLAYLASKRWSRLHCPDVILGVYTPDELEEIDVSPQATPSASAQNAQPGTRAQSAKERAAAKANAINGTARVIEPEKPVIPTLAEMIAKITQAQTLEQLAQGKVELESISQHFSDDDWDQLGKALRLRKQQLSQPATQDDFVKDLEAAE